MSQGIIYRISSHDNALHYYGLTTLSLENRFIYHLKKYNTYKLDYESTSYCSSFIIFEKYPIDLIQYTTIEYYPNITKKELLLREKYYIQNYDCVNILSKHQISHTNFYDINYNIVTHISHHNIITIHNYDTNIIPLLNLFGYYYTTNNTFKHNTDIVIIAHIHTKIKPIIHTYLRLNLIPIIHKKNALLHNIHNILQLYNLQLLIKPHNLYIPHTNRPIFTYKLLINNTYNTPI